MGHFFSEPGRAGLAQQARLVTNRAVRCRAGIPLLIATLLLLPWRAGADAIMISRAMLASTIAEVFVGESAVRVELEIGIGDLAAFRNLLPDPVYERLGNAPEPLAQRLPRFFLDDLVIEAEDGAALPGRVVEIAARPRVGRDEITGQPLPAAAGEAETVVFAVLEYRFSGRPASLTLRPPGAVRGGPRANIGFVVYHLGLPVIDFRYLGSQEVLDLDWGDPWYSRFRNRNLRRQYDAPLNAFLYVEPYEVRAEIIARPLDLQHWLDLGLAGRRSIPADDQAEIKRAAAEFLAEHVVVRIDGEVVPATLDRVHFLRRTLRSSTVIDPPEELDVLSATLGVIFVFPAVALPDEVTLTWDLFSPRIQRVPAAATDEAGPLPSILQPDDPVLRWQNFLKHPTLPTLAAVGPPPAPWLQALAAVAVWLALLLVVAVTVQAVAALRGRAPSRGIWAVCGALAVASAVAFAGQRSAAVNDDKASEILASLLHNVYRAFDFRDESTIYDVLERSATGDLLVQIYLETRRGLELASQGGARAKVKEVELVSVRSEDLEDGAGFRAHCTWNVRGSVGHWGHIHQRTNQYEAELTVAPVDGHWKITDLELLQEERL
jgi:hypothetical protein